MLKVDWEPGAAYTLAVDSLAMTDIYGLQTKPLKVDFNVRKWRNTATSCSTFRQCATQPL